MDQLQCVASSPIDLPPPLLTSPPPLLPPPPQVDQMVDKLKLFAANPLGELSNLLGLAAPQQATFFMTFTLVNIGGDVSAPACPPARARACLPACLDPVAACRPTAPQPRSANTDTHTPPVSHSTLPSNQSLAMTSQPHTDTRTSPPATSLQGIGFLRVVGLVLFWVFSKLSATQRAKRRLWTNQEMLFGAYTTQHTMTVLFGVVFSTISPLMAPVCTCYFAAALLLEKYNLVYVFTHAYEATGRMWPMLFGQVRCSGCALIKRCGAVRCGVVWCGAVWCGVVWCGVVWCGAAW